MSAVEMTPEANGANNVLSFWDIMKNVASNSNVDADKVTYLYEMHQRELKRLAEVSFRAGFAKAQAEIEPIARRHKNDQTRSKYAKLEDIIEAVAPILSEHEFAMSFGTEDSHLPNHYRVTCSLTHSAGHCEFYHVDIPMDNKGIKGTANKTDTHAFGSTMSYGRRYLMCLIWNIATPDDNDGNREQQSRQDQRNLDVPISEEQAVVLKDIAEKGNVDVKSFCQKNKIRSLDDILVRYFRVAKSELESLAKKSVPLPEGVH